MIYNYLKIAVRNLLKYRFISFINLFGLTVGLTCCLLIFTYIVYELSYDKSNKDAKKALSEPFNVMLSEEVARKYFGDEDPIDKMMKADNQFLVKVAGIYKAFPGNTHLHPGVLISFNTLKDPNVYGEENLRTNWGNNSFFTYIRLPEKYDPKKLDIMSYIIVILLSKDFLKLVMIAALFAFPVAWYAMNNWLQDFAYRTSIPWRIFLLAGIAAAAIALFTISFQAIKAALANPVKSLRTE